MTQIDRKYKKMKDILKNPLTGEQIDHKLQYPNRLKKKIKNSKRQHTGRQIDKLVKGNKKLREKVHKHRQTEEKTDRNNTIH